MAIDWTKIYKKYKGLWVGLKDDNKTVVASGKTVAEMMENARRMGFKNPIVFRVPSEIIPFVGIF
jgi:hypothetical protein